MSKVFFVNIGANKLDRSRARSPLFKNGKFVYVPFSQKRKVGGNYSRYPRRVKAFVHNIKGYVTHNDPDWRNFTYGDNCSHGRASALREAKEGDVLLFWGLLWCNCGKKWDSFTDNCGWYLLGAIRIDEILRPNQTPKDARRSNTHRAKKNAHFREGILAPGNFVFIGHRRYSKLFSKAVDLQVERSRGLLFRTIRSADGEKLKSPWYSSVRACRAVWNLDDSKQLSRAKIMRKKILKQTGYDLLRDMSRCKYYKIR
jgi:hypothetical protein